MTAGFVFGLIALAAVLANIAIRDHRRTIAARRCLLDACLGVVDEERWLAGGDGFPTIEGRAYGRPVKATLIPDTMVMRRLPQLWLSVTMLHRVSGAPSLSVLARHRGNEFYSATDDLPERIEPPPGLPTDVLIRGEGAQAALLCRDLTPVLARLLEDPSLKEIVLTAKGVRIIHQVAEGRRGEHLLLRQAVFADAEVARATFVKVLSEAAALIEQRDAALEARAA